MKNIRINTDLGLDYQDEGPWRSYELYTYGESLTELLENATIGEIDQDGGELDCYNLKGASNEIQDIVDRIIAKEFVKSLENNTKVSK